MREEEGREDTYPALLLSSSQLLDWSGLGWILRSHWGRATQNRRPKERKMGKKKQRWGEKEKEIRRRN